MLIVLFLVNEQAGELDGEDVLPGAAVAVEPSKSGMVAPVLEFVTPAVAQLAVFLGTLLSFLAGQMEFRRYMVSLFASRQAKLRFMRILTS